jgi:hypothetical protein
MASVFWDAFGIIFIEYLKKGPTIKSEYYTALMERLNDEIKKNGSISRRNKSLSKSYYKNGIEKLYDRYNRCITLEGNYIE